MDIESLEKEFRKKICDEIEIFHEGKNRFIISAPFTFGDGDFLNVVLKKNGNDWYFTDEGHTFMHLSYDDLDFERGKRKEIINSILKAYYLENDSGELKCSVEDNCFSDGFYTFIQGLIKVTDIAFTKRERIRSLFYEEFQEYLVGLFGDKCYFDYKESTKDPNGKYPVDCYVENEIPLFIFGIYNNDKCRDAMITCLTFERWGSSFVSIGIFENQEDINKKVLARFSDVIEKQYSSLSSSKERLPNYLSKLHMLS